MKKRGLSILLTLCLTVSLAAPALAAERAAAIRLTKTTGTVEVSKSSGKTLSLLSNMRLYNGYHVTTSEESYAWLNLDDVKLIKEDAASEIEVRKDGKKLEVNICSGNVFFDVAEKLEDDESLNISTSTMILGVRGTIGYVQIVGKQHTKVTILEGEARCSVTDPVTGQVETETIRGGETAQCMVSPQEEMGEKCDIQVERCTVEAIPGFALTSLVEDVTLCDRVEQDSGLDILRELAETVGGDPSGRSPDGKSASAEVLGEAARQESRDEAALEKKLVIVERAEKRQELEDAKNNNSSSDDSSSGGSSSGGGSQPEEPPVTTPTRITVTMPQSASDIQTMLSTYDTVVLQPDTSAGATNVNNLELTDSLTVAAGKTLSMEGVSLTVKSGGNLRVDGTLTVSSLSNYGTVTVTSSNTLRTVGDCANHSSFTVTATGKLMVGSYLDGSAALNLTDGAQVLAKNLSNSSANVVPEGWMFSTAPDSGGYYQMLRVQPKTITFDANGGVFTDGSAVVTAATGADGKLSALPADPTHATYTFTGWFDAQTGGNPVTTDTVFTQSTTVYAQWKTASISWEYDVGTKTLTISGYGPMDDFNFSDKRPPWEDKSNELTTVVINSGITAVGHCAFGGQLGGQYASLNKVTIPETVISIGMSAFVGCTSLTSITIPDSVTSIGNYAFEQTGLTSVNIPAKVTSIGERAFSDCSALTSVTFAADSQLNSIGASVFFNCTSLTGIDIPSGVTSTGESAFFGCESLTGITVAADNSHYCSENGVLFDKGKTKLIAYPAKNSNTTYEIPSGVTSIGEYAFDSCSNLTSITIPATMTSIGQKAFYGCRSLTSITIPGGVTSIGEEAFAYSGLTSITIPTTVASIGNNAFFSCISLTSITIPDGVTSIGGYTFRSCSALTSVIIPASVTSIGENAFDGCTGGLTITFNGTQEQWNSVTKGIGAIPSGVTVTCSDGTTTTT